MRVMEFCLHRFANKLYVPFSTSDNWHAILRNIKTPIDTMPVKPDRKRLKREAYEDTYSALSGVKAAWRNPTMHPRATYTLREAGDIYDMVRMFTGSLARLLYPRTRLKTKIASFPQK
jgi:hypothetical protein